MFFDYMDVPSPLHPDGKVKVSAEGAESLLRKIDKAKEALKNNS